MSTSPAIHRASSSSLPSLWDDSCFTALAFWFKKPGSGCALLLHGPNALLLTYNTNIGDKALVGHCTCSLSRFQSNLFFTKLLYSVLLLLQNYWIVPYSCLKTQQSALWHGLIVWINVPKYFITDPLSLYSIRVILLFEVTLVSSR